jgi:hypothetical protein
LIVSGAALARASEIPKAQVLVEGLRSGVLVRYLKVKEKDYERALAKREILSDQYFSDIAEGARVGFGAVSVSGESGVGCVVVEGGRVGHDRALESVLWEHRFATGGEVGTLVELGVEPAFRQSQKGNCGFIYSSAEDLKLLLDAAAAAQISFEVLPVWISASTIAARVEQLAEEASRPISKPAIPQTISAPPPPHPITTSNPPPTNK